MKGMYDYFLSSNSLRVVDIIASVQEPHDGHFFDKYVISSMEKLSTREWNVDVTVIFPRSLEGLRSTNQHPHLTLLGYVVRRRPTWLFKISQHSVFNELIRLLKVMYEKNVLIHRREIKRTVERKTSPLMK